MGLTLTIENEARLPDGGPLSFTLPKNRSADIGRDAHLDWTLPDPTRFISGKHGEITWRDGGYWLTDVSTNGTFLNGSDRRVQSPHRLRTNDRLTIGHYIVRVDVTEDEQAVAWASHGDVTEDGEDLWGGGPEAAPPIDPRELRPRSQNRSNRPDFLEWAVDVPNSPGLGFVAKQVTAPSDPGPARIENWDAGALPLLPEPEPPVPRPTPRRGVWVGAGPESPWGGNVESPPEAVAPWESRQPAPPPERRPPVAPPGPGTAPAVAAGGQAPPSDIVTRFARGAGLPPDALAAGDPGQFAEKLGQLMLLVVDNVKQLLQARSHTKRVVRSSSHTTVAALDNNPLKFAPGGAEALRLMLGPRTGAYLDADAALRQSFADLKAHHLRTFSAMQRAVDRLVADLDPAAIEAEAGKDKGFVDKLGSRRGRLWARYEALWSARSRREGGMREQFMQYFAECYDEPVERREDGARPERF